VLSISVPQPNRHSGAAESHTRKSIPEANARFALGLVKARWIREAVATSIRRRCSNSFAANDRRVLCLDYRGRGRSDYDPYPEHYAIAVEAADVFTVMAALEARPAIIVGTSRGGLIAMTLAAEKPELLAGIVLNDIGPVIEIGRNQSCSRQKRQDRTRRSPYDRHLFKPVEGVRALVASGDRPHFRPTYSERRPPHRVLSTESCLVLAGRLCKVHGPPPCLFLEKHSDRLRDPWIIPEMEPSHVLPRRVLDRKAGRMLDHAPRPRKAAGHFLGPPAALDEPNNHLRSFRTGHHPADLCWRILFIISALSS
jgi:pimeloyl-ACP methyl ester carboxylesterase